MAGLKEIRTHIDSVEQTLKITNAMYLISSSVARYGSSSIACSHILRRLPQRLRISYIIRRR